jgi:hypothetical protein
MCFWVRLYRRDDGGEAVVALHLPPVYPLPKAESVDPLTGLAKWQLWTTRACYQFGCYTHLVLHHGLDKSRCSKPWSRQVAASLQEDQKQRAIGAARQRDTVHDYKIPARRSSCTVGTRTDLQGMVSARRPRTLARNLDAPTEPARSRDGKSLVHDFIDKKSQVCTGPGSLSPSTAVAQPHRALSHRCSQARRIEWDTLISFPTQSDHRGRRTSSTIPVQLHVPSADARCQRH